MVAQRNKAQKSPNIDVSEAKKPLNDHDSRDGWSMKISGKWLHPNRIKGMSGVFCC